MKNMSKKIVSIVMIVIMLSITGLSQAESDLDTQKQENNEKITEAQEQKEEVQEQKNQTIEDYENKCDEINLCGLARLPLRHGQPCSTGKSN